MNNKKLAFVGNSAKMMYNFRISVMKNCVKQGYDVTVIAVEDFDVSLYEELGIHFLPITVDSHGTNIIHDFSLLNQLKRIYRRQKFDFIFHYTIKAVIYGEMAARRTKTPSISIITGLGQVFINDTHITRVVELLYKYSLRHAKEVWFLNDDDRQLFLQRKLVSIEKVRILPGEGVNTELFCPQEKQGKGFSFLYLGRLLAEKGVGDYAEAARIIHRHNPEVQFCLLGAFDSASEITPSLVDTWEQEGITHYLGETTNVIPFIREADCIVLPSAYREGVPRSLMEAAAMEKPIIATDNIGCRDIVKNGKNGFLCNVRDVKSLSHAMKKIIKLTPEERLAMGKEGRQLVLDKFEDGIVIDIYNHTLHRYLKQ